MSLALLDTAALPALVLVTITCVALVLSHNWRASILALAVQYIGVFVLAALSWPVEMAVSKLVAGWMACAVLGIAISEAAAVSTESWQEAEKTWPSSRLFRTLASILAVLTMLSVTPEVMQWIPGLQPEQAGGALILVGMGLLHLGFTSHPLRVGLALLTVLSGFEILYAVVETSALVTGLLAAVNLGLALVAAYLLLAPSIEETA